MSLAVEAKAWKMLLCRYLNEEYKKKMLDMISFIGEHLKMLSRPLQDLDDVRFAMQALLEIRDTEIQIDMTLGPIEVSCVKPDSDLCQLTIVRFLLCTDP